MLCLSYHLCITFPIQRGGDGERGREKRTEERKRGLGRGGEKKGAGARQKEKITLLPGLMNMGKG